MNKILLSTIFTLIVAFNLQSQDYYWVGGTGNWTDVSHWATTSGGSTMHTVPPAATNDVYFDANSFSENNQDVTLDADSANCKTLDFTGVTNDPTFEFGDYYYKIFIHGDFIITDEMQYGFQQNWLVGENVKINTNGIWSPGTFYIDPVNENTSIELLSDFYPSEILVRAGNFKTNNNNIEAFSVKFGGTGSSARSSSISLGSSTILTGRFVTYPNNATLDAGTSEINIVEGTSNSSVLFFGEGYDYHHVSFDGVIDRVKGNSTFKKFKVLPGSEITLEDGDIQTAEEFVFMGTSTKPISFLSREDGEAGIISQASGTVNGNYLILKDNTATGGATFNADNSTDLGNVSGWNIEVTAPADYYWVGNSGDWSDLNHWAKTSGGSNLHNELPTAIDDVYFDENSFDNATSVVDINVDLVFVNSISTEGTKAGTEFTTSNPQTNVINVYETIALAEDVMYRFNEIHFLGTETYDILTNGSHWGFNSVLFFEGTGTYNLADDFNGDEITIRGGTFNSNGYTITNDKFDITPLDDPTVNLDDSDIICARWFPSTNETLSINNTTITCGSQFYGRGHDYKKVTFVGGSTWVYGNFFAETLEFLPNSEIQILPGDSVYFENLIANGTASEPIVIESRTAGEEAYLSKASGIAEGEYLVIRDNHAIGGATFKANNSTIEENVKGWNELPSGINFQNLVEANVYPNPTSEYVIIEIDLNEKISDLNFRLYNSIGKLVNQQIISDNRMSIDVSNLSKGLYHLGLFNHNQEKLFIKSLVVE